MAEGVDIGALSGQINFEDNVTSTMDLILKKIDELEGGFDSLGGRVASSAAGFFTAEVALRGVERAMEGAIDVLKDLTVGGAGMADIEENFLRLNQGAGRLSETLLGSLREGTRNTITDLELMTMVSQDLTANMNLTDGEFRKLADGAFAMAQARGEDVGKVLNVLNDAMLTGRTRALALYTGKIDLAKAEAELAAASGKTADRLNEEGKLQAARMAIMDAIGKSTARLGEQTEGLDEIVLQATTSWSNLWEKLSIGVSTSPNVITAFTTIRDTLIEAFGGDSQEIVATFVGWINNIADAVTEYGPIVIRGFVDIKQWVVDVYATVRTGWDMLPDWFRNAAGGALLTVAAFGAASVGASTLSGGMIDLTASTATIVSGLTNIPELLNNLRSGAVLAGGAMSTLVNVQSLTDARAAVNLLGGSITGMLTPLGTAALMAGLFFAAWEVGKTQPVSDFFEKIGLRLQGLSEEEAQATVETHRMLEAQEAQAETSKVQSQALERAKDMMKELTGGTVAANSAIGEQNSVLQQNNFFIESTTAELKKRAEAMEEIKSSGQTWQDTVKGIDKEIQDTIKNYLAAGVAQNALATAYGLTATQVKALATSLKEEQDALKLSDKAAADSEKRWTDYYALLQEMSGTATDQTIADVERWKAAQIRSHVDAKTDTADFYSWLRSMETAHLEFADQQRLLQDTHSRASFEQRKRDTQDEYDFALQHSDQFTTQWIEHLRIQKDAAADAAASWTTSMGGALDLVTEKVRTLSGEWITLEERMRRQSMGGSYDVSGLSKDEIEEVKRLVMSPSMGGSGMTAEQAKEFVQSKRPKTRKRPSPVSNEDFAGTVSGSSLTGDDEDDDLSSTRPSGRGRVQVNKITNHFHVNGTARESARQIGDILMRDLKMSRKFGNA